MRISDWSSDVCSSDLFFAVVILTFLAPIVADFALAFGPAELFAVQLLTFCSFVGMGKEPPMKTIASMMFGFALAAVGQDPTTGQLRMTFGWSELLRGFGFHIAVIGLFGFRSEERRVGKQRVSTCRLRWSADLSKKNSEHLL